MSRLSFAFRALAASLCASIAFLAGCADKAPVQKEVYTAAWDGASDNANTLLKSEGGKAQSRKEVKQKIHAEVKASTEQQETPGKIQKFREKKGNPAAPCEADQKDRLVKIGEDSFLTKADLVKLGAELSVDTEISFSEMETEPGDILYGGKKIEFGNGNEGAIYVIFDGLYNKKNLPAAKIVQAIPLNPRNLVQAQAAKAWMQGGGELLKGAGAFLDGWAYNVIANKWEQIKPDTTLTVNDNRSTAQGNTTDVRTDVNQVNDQKVKTGDVSADAKAKADAEACAEAEAKAKAEAAKKPHGDASGVQKKVNELKHLFKGYHDESVRPTDIASNAPKEAPTFG